ncbi:MAG: hypothetical protein ABEH40_08150 [Haloferacaceae archaeon]
MRSEDEVRARIEELERAYDDHDPPASPAEERTEIALLRAIEELEWVLGARDADEEFTR